MSWCPLVLIVKNNVSCCVYCADGTSFQVKIEVDVDEHSYNVKPRPYVCTVCDKQFTQKGSLNAHKQTHSGEKLYSCSQCGKRYMSQCSLTSHEHIHTGKYKCTECGKCFRSNSSLVTHRRSHTGEKPFECNVCSNVCSKRVRTSCELRITTEFTVERNHTNVSRVTRHFVHLEN